MQPIEIFKNVKKTGEKNDCKMIKWETKKLCEKNLAKWSMNMLVIWNGDLGAPVKQFALSSQTKSSYVCALGNRACETGPYLSMMPGGLRPISFLYRCDVCLFSICKIIEL